MERSTSIECNLFFDDKDEDVKVEVQRQFRDDVLVKFPQIEWTMFLTERQAVAMAESLMRGVKNLPPKPNPFMRDKCKGDAFEALRKAEQNGD